MRKLFSLLLALVATTALWAEDFEVNGIYYKILTDKTNEVEVTYRGSSYSSYYFEYTGSVTIPSSVTYNGTTYSVTSIGERAFWVCSGLTSVTIPNSVTSIGYGAFAYCSGLTSITIPNSVTSIGNAAFEACSGLTSITIPNSVTTIGGEAFRDCDGLTEVTIPNSVTNIGYSAFYNCSGLTSVTIPNSVTSIGGGAFSGCSGLISIVVAEGNPVYDSRENCNAIIRTELNELIAGCQNTIIPNSVTSIGDKAFRGCTGLTSVTIPNSVTSIGSSAFSSCSGLTSVTIPNSVTSIGDDAFRNCTGLTSVTIPNSVTSIGGWAFYGCSGLTSITIPNSVTSIGDGAFRDCSGLTSITIPNSVTSIGNAAFEACSGLTSVTIPNSVTSIGDDAFRNCTGLTSVTIPNSVTSIGGWAFYGCSGLTSPVYNAHCFAYLPTSYQGAYTIPEGIKQIAGGAFYYCSGLTSVTIGNSVTTIGGEAFRDCDGLTEVTIPNSVTNIGYSAFYNCSGLTSITIPNSVTSIGDWAFDGCSGLTFIESLAEVPPTLGSSAFNNVSKKIPVYVPCGSVSAYQSSGWKAFTNIQEPLAMYSIEVGVNDSGMGTAQVDENTICGAQISATANYRYRFVQWSDGNTDNPRTLELTQDTILTAEFAVSYSGQCGDNLYWAYDEDSKKISITGSGDMYDYTKSTQPWLFFQEQITEVTTSNTTTSIGTSAFEGCIRLGKVSLGYGMGNIAAKAFAECKRLYDVYVYATYPPCAEESSFANYNVDLYIPCESKRDYEYDIVWGTFKYIECIGAESDDTGGDDIVITPGSTDVTITWPTEGNADTYTIVIKKDGEVVCTLTFNSEGQLLNIAFAPGRNGNHPAQYAEQAANGYRFTVTGLEEGTDYTYDITVKDASNKTIKSHSGKFTTESLTAVENTHIQSPISNCQKILRDGQLLILRDGVEYNAMGQEL